MKKELLLFFIPIVMPAPQNNKNKRKTHTETTPIIESRERGLQDLTANYPIKTPILHTEYRHQSAV